MRWAITIPIDDLITEDDSAEGIIAAADGLEARLGTSTAPFALIRRAREIAKGNPDDAEEALAVFNAGLNRIYDWADANRVWLRGPV